MTQLPARRWTAAVPFVAILSLAAVLRLLFKTGLADVDALIYSHLARNVADGVFRLNYEGVPLAASARVGLYGPVGLIYRLLGVSDATTFAWIFGCGLLGVVFAYLIGRKVAGEAAGLLSAFLWAVLPTGVAASTAFMGDGPIAALSLGVVYFVLVAETSRGAKMALALAAALACLGLGFATKPAISLLMVFLIVYAMWRQPRSAYAWGGLLVALFGLFVAYSIYTSQTSWSLSWLWLKIVPSTRTLVAASSDWWAHVVLGSPEFSWIAPLWIVAIAVLVALRERRAYVPLIWFASVFLYLQFGTRSLAYYEPITTASLGTGITRHFLLVAAPATLVLGIYLAQSLTASAARWLISVVSGLTATVAWWGMRHATNLDWGITGETLLPFEAKSAAATAIVVFGGLASPAIVVGASSRIKTACLGVLCLAIGVASLNPSYRAANTYRAVWPQTMADAVRFLEQRPAGSILVQNPIFAQRLDYASGFRFGFTSALREVAKPRIFLAPQDPAIIHDAFILIDDYYLRTSHDALWGDGPAYFAAPPPNFVEVARFGDRPGYRLRVYQVAESTAAVRLAAARAALTTAPTAANVRSWMDAAAAAHEYCEAASAWQRLRSEDPSRLANYDPVPLLRECVVQRPDLRSPNLFTNADFAAGLQGWPAHPDAQATASIIDDSARGRVWHVKWTGGNWNVLNQEQALQPDTVYVYEADIKTVGSVVALYWGSDVGRFAEIDRKFPEWTHVRYVFVTPHWNGQPWRAGFNPVLMNKPGPSEAWIGSLRLSELRIPRN